MSLPRSVLVHFWLTAQKVQPARGQPQPHTTSFVELLEASILELRRSVFSRICITTPRYQVTATPTQSEITATANVLCGSCHPMRASNRAPQAQKNQITDSAWRKRVEARQSRRWYQSANRYFVHGCLCPERRPSVRASRTWLTEATQIWTWRPSESRLSWQTFRDHEIAGCRRPKDETRLERDQARQKKRGHHVSMAAASNLQKPRRAAVSSFRFSRTSLPSTTSG